MFWQRLHFWQDSGKICVLERFKCWRDLRFGKICIVATFAFWWHLRFVDIWVLSKITLWNHLCFGNICHLVTFKFLQNFSFGTICNGATFAFCRHLRFGNICALTTFAFGQHLCFDNICFLHVLSVSLLLYSSCRYVFPCLFSEIRMNHFTGWHQDHGFALQAMVNNNPILDIGISVCPLLPSFETKWFFHQIFQIFSVFWIKNK